MLISAIGCGAGEPQSQGVAWQLDTFALRYNCTPITETSPDISPIVKPGQDVYIYAEIRNVGTEAGAYEWRVYLDNVVNPFYNKTTSNLAAGSLEGSSELIGHPVGSVCITISSDVIGQHEVKIGTVTRHFTVQAPAEISAVTVVPSCIAWLNSDLTITGQIRNPGSNNEDYIIHLDVDGNPLLRNTKHYTVPRDSTVEFTFFLHNEYNYNIGCHSFLITVDGSESKGNGEFEVGTGDYPCTGTCGSGTSVTPLTAATPSLTLASATLPDGVVGQLYTTDDVKPTGGITPYSYSIIPGSLPAGLSIVPLGDHFRIEGTPTAYGQYEFDITVNNSGETTGGVKATYKLTVIPNLNGKWMMTTTVTQANGACAGESGTSTREITVTQNGKNVTFSGFQGSQANQLNGAILPPKSSFIDVIKNTVIRNDSAEQWVVYVSGSYPEDFGTTTSTRRLVINDTASRMDGEESWSWTGGGGTCPDGKGVITTTRIP
jgi:hypothetical protein